jgi:hypothetical protein
MDSFRAHFNYGCEFVWTNFHTRLPDGRIFGISMSEGIGMQSNMDRASEDFVNVDGKLFKLD